MINISLDRINHFIIDELLSSQSYADWHSINTTGVLVVALYSRGAS